MLHFYVIGVNNKCFTHSEKDLYHSWYIKNCPLDTSVIKKLRDYVCVVSSYRDSTGKGNLVYWFEIPYPIYTLRTTIVDESFLCIHYKPLLLFPVKDCDHTLFKLPVFYLCLSLLSLPLPLPTCGTTIPYENQPLKPFLNVLDSQVRGVWYDVEGEREGER